VNCHFNNSNSLRTHDLTFATVSNISYTCTICHIAGTNRSIIPEINEWNASAHNDKKVGVNKSRNYNGFYFNNTGQLVNSRENSCLKCHSPLNWDPAIAELVTTKVQLTDDFKGITCTICHNKDDMVNWINTNNKVYAWYNRDAIRVSSSEYRANYTLMASTTELCGNCHSNIKYGNTGPGWASATATTPIKPHGFPAKDMFIGSPKESGQNFECIDCHMYINPEYGNGTMNDSDKITGHSFKVNESALQNTSCGTTCHDGTNFKTIPKRIEEIQTETQDKWNATNISVMAALDRWNKSTGVRSLSADKISVAYWNLNLVASDESWGVHNPDATLKLLDDAATLANASNDSLGQATSNIDLVTGWNLVALNGTPSATAPVSVLLSVHDNVTVVWGYNATSRTWELYDPVMVPTSLNTLTAIVPGKGYWILATQGCEWTI
jgi:formate-dependent nitrite reductase cytochrome c552 subunit